MGRLKQLKIETSREQIDAVHAEARRQGIPTNEYVRRLLAGPTGVSIDVKARGAGRRFERREEAS